MAKAYISTVWRRGWLSLLFLPAVMALMLLITVILSRKLESLLMKAHEIGLLQRCCKPTDIDRSRYEEKTATQELWRSSIRSPTRVQIARSYVRCLFWRVMLYVGYIRAFCGWLLSARSDNNGHEIHFTRLNALQVNIRIESVFLC